MIKILTIILALIMSNVGSAARTGFGGVAQNLMEPVGLFSDFVQTGCLVIGGAFVFASVVKYFEHKRSPLMVPMSTVVFLLIAGTLLLLLPLLSYITENGIPYFLFVK